MQYFDYLSDCDLSSLFFKPPEAFFKTTERETLRLAVGGLLYTPAFNRQIARSIINGKIPELTSMAVCLEDSVGDDDRIRCVENTQRQFEQLAAALDNGSLPENRLPLLFVRVKDCAMLEDLAEFFISYSRVITGVILPKAVPDALGRALVLAADIGRRACEPFYVMPILESRELMERDDRTIFLRELREIADESDQILNIRVGATDLCGLYGIRRSVDTPIYSIAVAAGIIADIVRIFAIDDRYTVSGPVWEYFSTFARACALRRSDEIDGLLREVRLDLQNGILGKTCVHPTQLPLVQASYAVPYEQYQDALGILGGDQGTVGVLASVRQNKMNELKPHTLWARKLLQRAHVYGVYQENTNAAGFLRAVYGGEFKA
ncbi:HpcH/HpaI aldolase/citrate lyase family protein [Anaerotruncus colihominis]|uniref:HpcH/HpaI aldolase/citrate lyase family protein n=1 Tax=Anaerotruncus colihominis TaxID=169435 RepID=UPI0018AACBC1|nr:HpcH/HpaI aldolase/citrate lyase family protein [Anaerotruncus colihominis]